MAVNRSEQLSPQSEQEPPIDWLALIVVLSDGSEICPWLVYVNEFDQRTPRAETFNANQYHLDLVQKYEGVSYRFENLTQREIYDRGYREKPWL